MQRQQEVHRGLAAILIYEVGKYVLRGELAVYELCAVPCVDELVLHNGSIALTDILIVLLFHVVPVLAQAQEVGVQTVYGICEAVELSQETVKVLLLHKSLQHGALVVVAVEAVDKVALLLPLCKGVVHVASAAAALCKDKVSPFQGIHGLCVLTRYHFVEPAYRSCAQSAVLGEDRSQ